MVSPSFPIPSPKNTNNDAAAVTLTSGKGYWSCNVACTCHCHFCVHDPSSRRLYRVATVSMVTTNVIEEDYRHKHSRLPLADNADTTNEMTACHSEIMCPLRHKRSCSESSSSFPVDEENFEKYCDVSESGSKIMTTTNNTNCDKCKNGWVRGESFPVDEDQQTCLTLSSSNKNCTKCWKRGIRERVSVTDQSNQESSSLTDSEAGKDTHFVHKLGKNCRCSRCENCKDVVQSARYFSNGQEECSSNCKTSDTPKMCREGSDKSKSTMTTEQSRDKGKGGNCRTARFYGGERRVWLLCASLLFLSLAQSASSFSVFDDDDDDDYGNRAAKLSVYQRNRRSAEHFSSLNDALSLIPSNYSIHEPPPTNNSEATQVDFSVLIMNVRDIKELNEELSLEMNLRIYWKDTRLSHLADRSGNKFIVLNPVLLDKLWHPDIFIDHVKGVAQPALISKPASLRVYPDSSVRYSARITVTMACQMDFHYYPADTQRCNVDMKSFSLMHTVDGDMPHKSTIMKRLSNIKNFFDAYSSKILALDWREGKGALLVEYLELPNFDVALDTTQNFMVNTSSGSYSGIRFTILLRRKLSYHLIQTYLPSTLFIIVSWLSFLVPPESVPGRMALCMTTLLTLTAMFSAVRQNTPNVSYVKALDIWMVVCIIFVFLTLVEYTVLLKLKSKKTKPKPPASAHPERASSPTTQQQPQPTPRWTITSLQYTSDNSNFKFRGCKNVDGVISENGNNGTNGEMRHRENGDSTGAASGDNVNINTMNIPPPMTPQIPPPAPPPSAHVPVAPLPPPAPQAPGDRPLNKYELAAKKIEKFTSAVIPTLFVIFNFIYWPWLIESADYYHQDTSTTIFKSM